jgi:hypothetical protein
MPPPGESEMRWRNVARNSRPASRPAEAVAGRIA